MPFREIAPETAANPCLAGGGRAAHAGAEATGACFLDPSLGADRD
jgi:hypothetical protein